MIFTVNTKPLQAALNLGVISENISLFHRKSTIIELTANRTELRLNVESAQICSEMLLKGSGDTDESAKIFIGSLIFKQLMATVSSDVVKLEFAEGGLKIHSDRSVLTLPKLVDDDDVEFDRPNFNTDSALARDIDKTAWKFIKDRQMFAISLSFIHPVYSYVWMSDEGSVIVGDFDNSLFTYSMQGDLNTTCLVSDTIINLFESLPDGAKLRKVSDTDFVITYECDSFSYASQFTPKYENDQSIGSYNSEIFLDMMKHEDAGTHIDLATVGKYLRQASMLATTSDAVINLAVDGNMLTLKDNNVNCELTIENQMNIDKFEVKFKLENLKKVLDNYTSESVAIHPVIQDDEVAGLLVWDDDVTTIIAGVDN